MGFVKVNIDNFWNVNITLVIVIMRTFVGTDQLNILVFLRVLGEGYFALWTHMEQSDFNFHGLLERNRHTVLMCNIRLQVKIYCLIRLHLWMVAVRMHLLNHPRVQLFFLLLFELFLQGVFLILHISLARYLMMRVARIVRSLLGRWKGHYSQE